MGNKQPNKLCDHGFNEKSKRYEYKIGDSRSTIEAKTQHNSTLDRIESFDSGDISKYRSAFRSFNDNFTIGKSYNAIKEGCANCSNK